MKSRVVLTWTPNIDRWTMRGENFVACVDSVTFRSSLASGRGLFWMVLPERDSVTGQPAIVVF
jgi:hypothetical protein